MQNVSLKMSARIGLDSAMQSSGLLPAKKHGSIWASEDRQLTAWVVVDSKARDPYAGGAFTLEFEHSPDGSWTKKLSGRARVGGLVSQVEFESLVTLQREIVASLGVPPADHVAMLPESLRARYLSTFDPSRPVVRTDFWMRYTHDDHLRCWWQVLTSLLPVMIGRARSLDPHVLYLGLAPDW